MCVKKKYIPVDEHTLFYYNIMCNSQNEVELLQRTFYHRETSYIRKVCHGAEKEIYI